MKKEKVQSVLLQIALFLLKSQGDTVSERKEFIEKNVIRLLLIKKAEMATPMSL